MWPRWSLRQKTSTVTSTGHYKGGNDRRSHAWKRGLNRRWWRRHPYMKHAATMAVPLFPVAVRGPFQLAPSRTGNAPHMTPHCLCAARPSPRPRAVARPPGPRRSSLCLKGVGGSPAWSVVRELVTWSECWHPIWVLVNPIRVLVEIHSIELSWMWSCRLCLQSSYWQENLRP